MVQITGKGTKKSLSEVKTMETLKGIDMKNIISVFCLSIFFFLFIGCEKLPSDWVKYNTDDDGTVRSYKKLTVDKDKGEYLVKVCLKGDFSYKGREKIIQDRIKDGLNIEGYNKLSVIEGIYEVDCKKNRVRKLSERYYDTDKGSVLSEDNTEEKQWKEIFPNTVGEDILKGICKKSLLFF